MMASDPPPSPTPASADDVTELLLQWSNGNDAALQRLMPFVYDECRRIAARQMRGEREEHTLSPSALVKVASCIASPPQISRLAAGLGSIASNG